MAYAKVPSRPLHITGHILRALRITAILPRYRALDRRLEKLRLRVFPIRFSSRFTIHGRPNAGGGPPDFGPATLRTDRRKLDRPRSPFSTRLQMVYSFRARETPALPSLCTRLSSPGRGPARGQRAQLNN